MKCIQVSCILSTYYTSVSLIHNTNSQWITAADGVSSRRCFRGPIAAKAVMLASRCRISSISANCS